MAAPKKMRGRTWEERETRLLLEKWGDENIQLRLKSCTRKRPIWQEIGDFLMACGCEDREGEACKTRLHTLVTAYRQSKDELKKTGNATPSKKPPFFDELDKILSDNPSTQPKVSSVRQKLLRHHRVKTKVLTLTTSRRAAAATTTEIVAAVLLKYFRRMYCQKHRRKLR
ncbi:uncharacterized protein LOC122949479 [Acropora millepora]|uniref:uncharacterized protein LOC122949479 n=1 Tax=Acropora millepora TaxID=45264 RepID=UPI001CF4A619|nr:uncharacterized protein LOC122949479 [Acropora millepora]